MESLELPVSLENIIKTKEVTVVQAIDVEALTAALQWCVSKLQAQPTPDLAKENEQLRSQIKGLEEKQNDMATQLEKLAATVGEGDAARESLKDLPDRVRQLEDKLQDLSSKAPSAVSGQGASASDVGPVLDQLADRVAKLEKRPSGHTGGSGAPGGGISADEVAALLEPVKKRLDEKADRAELDALVAAGGVAAAAPAGPDSAQVPAVGAQLVAADGSVDSGALQEAMTKLAGDLSALRGQLAVLQQRVSGAATQASVDDIAALSDALRARLLALEGNMPKSGSAPVSPGGRPVPDPTESLQDLSTRLTVVELKLDAGLLPEPGDSSSGAGAGAGGHHREPQHSAGSGPLKRAVREALEHAKSVEDMLPLIKAIFDELGTKAERSLFDALMNKFADLAAKLDALTARTAGAERAASLAIEKAAAAGKGLPSSPSVVYVPQEPAAGEPAPTLPELPTRESLAAEREAKRQPSLLADTSAEQAVISPVMAAESGDHASAAELGALKERVRDLESDLGSLSDTVRALQDQAAVTGPRVDALEAAASDMARGLAGKADTADLDELKLRLALMGAGMGGGQGATEGQEGAAPAGGPDPDAVLSALKGLVADKATKAELEVVRQQLLEALDSKAPLSDMRALAAAADRAASEAAAAADAAAGAAASAGAAGGSGLLTAVAAPTLPDVQESSTGEDNEGSSRAATPPAPVPVAVATPAGPGFVISPDQWETLQRQLTSRATRAELDALSNQVGDMFGDLAGLRATLAGMQASSPSGLIITRDSSEGKGSQQEGEGGDASASATAAAVAAAPAVDAEALARLAALGKEMQALREHIELLAHASNIMAVGLELPSHSFSGANGAAHAEGPPGLVGGREPRNPRGAIERLIKLLGRQAVNHKMDYFDPDVLNRMATKLGTVDALMMSPGFARNGASAVDQQMIKDLEAQIRRLARDMRALKDKVGDGMMGALQRSPDSDHAMLSGKPLMGYRCMACDRPLEKLDERPGPYIPNFQMPVRVPAASDALTKAALAHPRPGTTSTPLSPEASHHNTRGGSPLHKKAYDPSQRGPQTWYEESKAPPAEALPPADVGPKLPPGGWRGASTSGAKAGGVPTLPDISQGMPGSKPRSPTGTPGGRIPGVSGNNKDNIIGNIEVSVQDHAAIQANMF